MRRPPPCNLARANRGTCLRRHAHAIGGDFSLGPGGFIAPDLPKTPLQVKDGAVLVPVNGPLIRVKLDENTLRQGVIT
jgi:hypothetical protein